MPAWPGPSAAAHLLRLQLGDRLGGGRGGAAAAGAARGRRGQQRLLALGQLAAHGQGGALQLQHRVAHAVGHLRAGAGAARV
jgi:hypothetical protein